MLSERAPKSKVRSRATAQPARRRLRLSWGAHVGRDRTGLPVLLHEGGIVHLNEMAAAILGLCDGTNTRYDILARLVPDRTDTHRALRVHDFLDMARRLAWIKEEEGSGRVH
jgi:hypothetical protein